MAARHARLVRDCRTRYRDPMRFARGDAVAVDERDGEWPECRWATDPQGRSGWVHQRGVDAGRGTVRATRDYDAREPDAPSDRRVTLLDEAGGWWRCGNEHGAQGWLPARDLQIENE